jgi:hypothetical protein
MQYDIWFLMRFKNFKNKQKSQKRPDLYEIRYVYGGLMHTNKTNKRQRITVEAINNGHSRETGNIGYTRHKTNKRQRITVEAINNIASTVIL